MGYKQRAAVRAAEKRGGILRLRLATGNRTISGKTEARGFAQNDNETARVAAAGESPAFVWVAKAPDVHHFRRRKGGAVGYKVRAAVRAAALRLNFP